VIALVALLVLGAFAGGWFLGRPGAAETADTVVRPVLTHGQGGDVPEFGMSAGDCAPAPLERGSSFESGASIDCGGPHDFQVLADYDPFRSEELDHPGADLDPYAESFCLLVFNSERVTFADKDSALAVTPLVPTESSWADGENQNRTIYCVVSRRDDRQLDESVVRDD
jgi:hypothetical protein